MKIYDNMLLMGVIEEKTNRKRRRNSFAPLRWQFMLLLRQYFTQRLIENVTWDSQISRMKVKFSHLDILFFIFEKQRHKMNTKNEEKKPATATQTNQLRLLFLCFCDNLLTLSSSYTLFAMIVILICSSFVRCCTLMWSLMPVCLF